ncbi:MAG: 2-oxoacid:acceptor oxidoreductase subunit alpha [Candidatus Bathyarchaeota archaeon]|nr:MAG: 2-oxoacid:acceptor oxidoreductase subunit alpha [Candidatus Bathyarchaeota archaeon]
MGVGGLSWKIGGGAGYGIMTTGFIFSKVCSRAGLHVFDHIEYPSLIRGGHNTYQVIAKVEEVFSHLKKVDLLVALNRETIDRHEDELVLGGAILYDGDKISLIEEDLGRKDVKLYNVPLLRLAEESGGKRIMMNSVALGASVALIDFDFARISSVMRDVFQGKARDTIDFNIKAAKLGYDYVKCKAIEKDFRRELPEVDGKKRMLLTGNEAVGLGAVKAGCKFYSAYPMTPSSSILHFMAAQERSFGMVVKHTEDEIAAINMAIGAGFAGARAMTATSGGGFSLMSEALGLAAMTETPIVVVVCQRPGPSTGLPTRTEQGDLKFILHASQGDFPRFVIAPGDVEECFYRTIEAFNLAEKYQCPVILLLDKYLSESHKTAEKFEVSEIKIERGSLLNDEELEKIGEFKRYEFTETGISPRAIPSQEGGIFTATGNEHDETGYLSEDKTVRTRMMDKRFRKFEQAKKEVPEPELFGPQDAEVTIIAWGSTKGPIKEAIRLLAHDEIRTNFLQIVYLNPFPADIISRTIDTSKKTVVVENNKTAQLANLIREKTGKEVEHKILKYDGRQFFPTEICQMIREVMYNG